MVALDEVEYFKVLEGAAANGVAGGMTYDALIAQCASKADAQTLYNWNTKHFTRLDEWVASRLKQP